MKTITDNKQELRIDGLDQTISVMEMKLRLNHANGDYYLRVALEIALACLTDIKNGCVMCPSDPTDEMARCTGWYHYRKIDSKDDVKQLLENSLHGRPKSEVDKVMEGLGE